MTTRYEQHSINSNDEQELWAQPSMIKMGAKESSRSKNRVKWTSDQNLKYCIFLVQNLEVLQSDTLRKQRRVFSRMSDYIGTRTNPQVKSHHQKMMKRHYQVPAIIEHMQGKLKVRMDSLEQGMGKQTKEVQLQTEELREYDSDCHLYPCQPEEERMEGQVEQVGQFDPFMNLSTWFDDF